MLKWVLKSNIDFFFFFAWRQNKIILSVSESFLSISEEFNNVCSESNNSKDVQFQIEGDMRWKKGQHCGTESCLILELQLDRLVKYGFFKDASKRFQFFMKYNYVLHFHRQMMVIWPSVSQRLFRGPYIVPNLLIGPYERPVGSKAC